VQTGSNLLNLNLPIEPNGVIYNSMSRAPIPGATVEAKSIEEIAQLVASAGTRFSSHNWRSVTSGVSGGWTVARALFMLNALLGAVATEGGVFPNAWNKFVPRPIYTPPHPHMWNEKTWPREFPLSMHEMSFLLPHLPGTESRRRRRANRALAVYSRLWSHATGDRRP